MGSWCNRARGETELCRGIQNLAWERWAGGRGSPRDQHQGSAEVRVAQRWPALLSSSPDSIVTWILAGCTTGAMAVTCAQPTDVVKIRSGQHAHWAGEQQEENGRLQDHRQEEGVRGLWKGSSGLQTWGAWAVSSPLLGLGQGTEQAGSPITTIPAVLKEYPNISQCQLTSHTAPNSVQLYQPFTTGRAVREIEMNRGYPQGSQSQRRGLCQGAAIPQGRMC